MPKGPKKDRNVQTFIEGEIEEYISSGEWGFDQSEEESSSDDGVMPTRLLTPQYNCSQAPKKTAQPAPTAPTDQRAKISQ